MEVWTQVYNPLGDAVLSTILAAVPLLLLLGLIATGKIKAHIAAVIALVIAILVAIYIFQMPAGLALRAAGLGALTGFFPIGWIILNVIFLYRLTVEKGWFAILQRSIGNITPDRRLQLLLIAFCFGAFFEGAAGFGTPVAVTGAILMGLGFSPLAAAGLSLIANTAPVAFGALGTPIQGLATATGMDPYILGAMVGRQLPFFSVLVPFWLIWAFAGWRGMIQVWPAILVCGISFAVPQFLISNYLNPWVAGVGAALVSLAVFTQFLKIWKPKEVWTSPKLRAHDDSASTMPPPAVLDGPEPTKRELRLAWTPWFLLCVIVVMWGFDFFKKGLNGIFAPAFPIEGLHRMIERVPPVVVAPEAEAAVFTFSFLSYSGTAILITAIISGFLMGYGPGKLIKSYLQTLYVVRYSLVTIVCMLSLGILTRYSGIDTTLGLAFASTGFFYPFFGTLLGWVGVAATGSDTASNVLFGGLQKVTSEQLGISPVLMAAANSSGGVMGKMIDAQSIVVASTATGWFGHEGKILRFVFVPSIVLATLVGFYVMLQAYVPPFTYMVIEHP